MTTSVERVFQTVQHLSPAEQLELIQMISQALRQQYRQPVSDVIPETVKRTAPITDLAQLAADFWPEDETADDINGYITQQRRDDRLKDL